MVPRGQPRGQHQGEHTAHIKQTPRSRRGRAGPRLSSGAARAIVATGPGPSVPIQGPPGLLASRNSFVRYQTNKRTTSLWNFMSFLSCCRRKATLLSAELRAPPRGCRGADALAGQAGRRGQLAPFPRPPCSPGWQVACVCAPLDDGWVFTAVGFKTDIILVDVLSADKWKDSSELIR